MLKISILMVLLTSFQITYAQISIAPVNPKSLGNFPNIRDFTTNGQEAYFSAQSPLGEISVILKMEKRGNKWSKPEIASFSGMHQDLEPFLSQDGLKLYFASNRPRDNEASKDYDIWYVSRPDPDDMWSEPVNLGTPVNSTFNEFYPVITSNNNLYFTSDSRGSHGGDDIVVCKWENGKYNEAESLGPSINTAGYEFNAFVSADESFMIFTGYNREDGHGSGDLYISLKEKDGWSKAINMGETINSEHMDYCPYVVGESLYYTSRRKLIKVPTNGFSSTKEFLSEINQYENGQSRIYEVVAFKAEDYK